MRRKTIFSGIGLALLAAPAFAHHGEESTHLLIEHGLGFGIAGLAVAAAGIYFLMRRKG